jgi:Mitochondrial K+-H+ exchange-related
LIARFREKHHQRLFVGSAIGVAPLLPLALSPFPNIPIYYVGYRVYSHRNAWRGAQAVQRILREHTAAQRTAQVRPQVAQVRPQVASRAAFM